MSVAGTQFVASKCTNLIQNLPKIMVFWVCLSSVTYRSLQRGGPDECKKSEMRVALATENSWFVEDWIANHEKITHKLGLQPSSACPKQPRAPGQHSAELRILQHISKLNHFVTFRCPRNKGAPETKVEPKRIQYLEINTATKTKMSKGF